MENSPITNGTLEQENPHPLQLDAEQVEILRAELRAQQNLPLAVLGGLIAALVGAILWAVITVVTSYQIGYMAIGVGYLAGFAVLKLGKGISPVYGIVGGMFALLGCLLGNLLSTCGFYSQAENEPVIEVIKIVFSQFNVIVDILKETFSGMDLLFYAIAIHGGYTTAIRKLSPEEIKKMV